jgi:capsular polysaccharide biosynthesis protein
MSLRDLLTVIWRRRYVVALVLIFCVGISAVYAFSRPAKNYGASATIAFLPDAKHEPSPPESLALLLNTYAVVAESKTNIEAAEESLGHPLAGSVSATPGTDSSILSISSEARNAEVAAETANAVSKSLLATIRQNGVVVPTVINPPVASTAPLESRSPKLVIGVAVVVGLVAGVLLALLLENLAGAPRTGDPSLTARPKAEMSA